MMFVKVLAVLFAAGAAFFSSTVQDDDVESRQTTHDRAQRTNSCTQETEPHKAHSAPTSPVIIKEPDDLGTPDLPRPSDITALLEDQKKCAMIIEILNRSEWGLSYYWNKYYIERRSVEEIVSNQEQSNYDAVWQRLRTCWKILHHPFWVDYVAGHFPDPQTAIASPELIKELCVLDVKELRSWQVDRLLEDGVYTLGVLQNSLFNANWQPTGLSDRDRWHFRQVLLQYGLEVPPSNEPDLIPFAELYIGAVFGIKVTPKKRLIDYGIIEGDEPLEDRVKYISENGLVPDYSIDACERILFYKFPQIHKNELKRALGRAQQSLKARKILAGGNYPEVRLVAEGVSLDELNRIFVKDLDLSSQAHRAMREYFFRPDEATVADLVLAYYNWLFYADDQKSTEIKEYLYQHGYVVRPEDEPMDGHTHIAHLRLPTRVGKSLRHPGDVETIDDLIRCCAGDDPVFTLRYVRGIGEKSMEVIRTRLVELGFMDDLQ